MRAAQRPSALFMPVPANSMAPRVDILDDRYDWLEGRARNIHSQFGEDGIVAALQERIPAENHWCFECGASDGKMFSNTRRLIEDGWKSLQIEPEPVAYAKLERLYLGNDAVDTLNRTITAEYTLDDAMRDANAPGRIDFGVIDVDGQDYWLLNDLTDHHPSILMVEHAVSGAGDWVPPIGGQGQATAAAIRRLGRSKGYHPVASTYCNTIFVRSMYA